MPTDPSIILAGNQPPDFTQNYMTLYQFAQQVNQQRQQQQSQNALKQIFANPQSYDPKTNTPTPNALRQIMQVNPDMGMKLQDDVLSSQVKRMQEKSAETDIGAKKFEFMTSVAGVATDAYNDAKASGKSESDAIHAATLARNEAVKSNGGVLGEDDADGIIGSAFDPTKAKALASANKEWVSTKSEAEKERHDSAMEANTARGQDIRIDTQGASKWEVLTDPKQGVQYRYNPETTESTTLDGKPFTPQGASKIAGGTPRSPQAMYMQKYMEENPDATSQDLANHAAQYQKTVVAGTADVKAESAGLTNLGKMRASVEQAEGNANKEADLVLSLAPKGAANGGPSMFNRWAQSVRTGVFNDPDVTAFQTSVESLKNEYVKVLSTTGGMSGGTSSDSARREADSYINPNLTEDQLKANISVMKKSMKNRTSAINQAYKDQQGRVDDTMKTDDSGGSKQKVLRYDVNGDLVP